MTNRLGNRLKAMDTRKVALAVFMVAIMIGAAMFVAFHELPGRDEDENSRRVLIWDFNIYRKKQSTYLYHASGLSMEVMFPRSPHLLEMRIRTPQVDITYEVVDLLLGPMNGAGVSDTPGVVYGNTITFENAFDNADLVYIMGANGVKELLVLKERPPFLSGNLVLRSQLYYPPSALQPEPTEDWVEGEVYSTDGFTSMVNLRNEEVLRIAPPFIFDSSDASPRSSDLDETSSIEVDRSSTSILPEDKIPITPRRTIVGRNVIVENSKGASIRTVVPWEFLSSQDTVYPVYIDPTISSPVNNTQWYQDALIRLDSNLTIVSGGSLNLYNVTLQVNHSTTNEYNIDLNANASFNIYRSIVEHNSSKGTNYYTFESEGNLTIQDSYVNYTNDGIEVIDGNCSLRNVSMGHSNGDGVKVIGGKTTIYDSNIHDSGDDGIDASNAHIDLLESTLTENEASGITVYNCTGNVSDTLIEESGTIGLSVSGGSSFNFLESTILNNTGTGVVVSGSSGLIYDNEITGNLHGLNLTSETNSTVTENYIHSNSENGINVIDSAPELSDNLVKDNDDGIGLYLSNSTPTTSGDRFEANYIGVKGLQIDHNITGIKVKSSMLYGVTIEEGDLGIINSSIENSGTSDIYVDENGSIITLNTYFNKGNTALDDLAIDLEVRWYLNLRVLADLDIPWVNGTVTIKNKNDVQKFQGPTNAYGIIPTQEITEYIQDSGMINTESPHRIIANLTDARVYISKSKNLTIYNRGDMDGDGLPDSIEESPGVIWYDAESHGYGASQIVKDNLALDREALCPKNGSDEILNKDTFFDDFHYNTDYKVMVRARSTVPGDNLTIRVSDQENATITTELFPLEDDYYWHCTEWFTPPPGRLYIGGSVSGTATGEVRIDSVCIIQREDPARPRAIEGQVTDPCNADSDGDWMPDGDERRNGTVWLEAEHGTAINLEKVRSNDYSNGQAYKFASGEPSASLAFSLNKLLATCAQGAGPMEEGHYILRIRACAPEGSGQVAVDYDGIDYFSPSLQISGSTLKWYRLNDLWIDPADTATTLTITRDSGTFVIDKVGLIMMVDDPDPLWNQALGNVHQLTPAVVGDVVVSTAPSNTHIMGIDGVSNQVLWSHQTTATVITSATVRGQYVYYVYNSASNTHRRCLDALTGQEQWKQTTFSSSLTPVGQAVLEGRTYVNNTYVDEQLVVVHDTMVEGLNLTNGHVLWTYNIPGSLSTFDSVPVVYGEYIIVLASALVGMNPYHMIMLDSQGNEMWDWPFSNQQAPEVPFGNPCVVNGKVAISWRDPALQTNGRVEAYSLDPDIIPVSLWSYSFAQIEVLATEPIAGNNSVIVLYNDAIRHGVVKIDETSGLATWKTQTTLNYNVLSISPCFVEGRIYYLTASELDSESTDVYLTCTDVAATVNRSAYPNIFNRLVSSSAPTFERTGSPVLADLDGNGYLQVIFNLEDDTRCSEGGGVWYMSATPWNQYHREEQRTGSGVHVLRFFPMDPDDLDMDHDSLRDGWEALSTPVAERFELEDIHDYSVTFMGSDYPAEANRMNLNFFHQTGVALRSIDPDTDDRIIDPEDADSWVEVEFMVPETGVYTLDVEPVNGYETKLKSLGIKGSGNGAGMYSHSGDGYNYMGDSSDNVGDAGFGMWWPVEEAFLKKVIENATFFSLSCEVDAVTGTRAYIPLEVPLDGFDARPSAIRQPVFDFTQVYIQGFFRAQIETLLSAGTKYYFRVGVDLDLVPEDLMDQCPLDKNITRLDILDVDFCLVKHYGLEPFLADCDEDGVEDGPEAKVEHSPWNADPDEDGISDANEAALGTDPMYRDTDFDGLRDPVELGYSQTDRDEHTAWDTIASKASLWEMVMAYCEGNPKNLSSSTTDWFPNWDSDGSSTTDPTHPDSDRDGLPDGAIDGWGYDVMADSRGDYTSQADNLYLYEKAFNRPYEESYWGFVGTSDNVAQVWEGEDFNLDGSLGTGGAPWSFEITDGSVGRRNGQQETDASSADTDGDGMSDGWEVLFSQEQPFWRIEQGQSIFSINPLNPDDDDEDVDMVPTLSDEVGDDPSQNLTLGPGNDYAYAFKFSPTTDTIVAEIAVELRPLGGIKGDAFVREDTGWAMHSLPRTGRTGCTGSMEWTWCSTLLMITGSSSGTGTWLSTYHSALPKEKRLPCATRPVYGALERIISPSISSSTTQPLTAMI